VNWRETTEVKHRATLKVAQHKHPGSVAVLAFSDRFL